MIFTDQLRSIPVRSAKNSHAPKISQRIRQNPEESPKKLMEPPPLSPTVAPSNEKHENAKRITDAPSIPKMLNQERVRHLRESRKNPKASWIKTRYKRATIPGKPLLSPPPSKRPEPGERCSRIPGGGKHRREWLRIIETYHVKEH